MPLLSRLRLSFSLNNLASASLPSLVSRSEILILPLLIKIIMPIYASPRAAVKAAATLPLTAPPATEPAPGIHLRIEETTVFPRTVAPVVPIVDDTTAVIVDFSTGRPKTAVIPASILTCSGTSKNASDTGIGIKPVAAALAAAEATMARALFDLSFILAF